MPAVLLGVAMFLGIAIAVSAFAHVRIEAAVLLVLAAGYAVQEYRRSKP